jgi:uncharacterized protein YndB with AHSA1/START domain
MPLATVSRPNHRRKPQSGEAKQIGAISREVSRQYTESGETVAVTVQRRYDADQADVWQAITDPERVRRWFLPVTGDLREGGNFQLEGNASGDIMTCEPPRHLMVTFGGESSIVDVLLSDDGQQTLLKLTHSVPIELAGSGAGALYVGPGWDGALLGLALHFAGEVTGDPVAAANSPEVQELQCHFDIPMGSHD